NVAGDFFFAKLRITGLHFVVLDMDGGEDVLGKDLFVNENGVLVVITTPRHERHEDVLTKGQVSQVGGGTIGNHIAGVDDVTFLNKGLLVNRRILVRALVLN